MKQKIINTHWMEGGTGLNNIINPKDVCIYTEAIRIYGDPCLVLYDKFFPPMEHHLGKSLHYIGKYPLPDLSTFWTIFRDLQMVVGSFLNSVEITPITKHYELHHPSVIQYLRTFNM